MSAIWAWLVAHRMVLGALVVGIIDFVWAVAPGLQSNGILHAIYDFLKPKALV